MDENVLFGTILYSIIIVNSIILTDAAIFGPKKSDPHLHSTTPQVIKQAGYPVQTHTVQTEDGYLITLHRIPYGRYGKSKKSNRYPLLLCHELLGSSYDFLLSGPEKSLGFRLPDEGYDVWLINFRGNLYSSGHVTLTQAQLEYWDFSFHEMGIYDIPASIDYILNITGRQQLTVIGHSMGNTAFYITAAMLPQYNAKVNIEISLGPIAAIPHSTTAIRLLDFVRVPIIITTNLFSSGAFLPRNRLTDLATDTLCNSLTRDFCDAVLIGPIFGEDRHQLDRNLIPPFFAHMPAGTSVKTLRHFNQLTFPNNHFRQFDYGPLANVAKYGTPKPPKYNLSNIKLGIRAYFAKGDILANPTDTRIFYGHIRKQLGLIRVGGDTFNHIDFLAATDINPLLNDDVIRFLNNVTRTSR